MVLKLRMVVGLVTIGGAVWVAQAQPADAPSAAKSAKDGRYISWREHIIDDEAIAGIPIRGADGLCVADIDKDGHRDVVSVHEDSFHIRVAFGTGHPDRWVNGTLASGALARQAEDCDIGDVNGDGRLDVVAACERGHLIYLEAPVNPRELSAWRPVILEATRGRGSWIRVKIADVDNDGRMEIIGANKGQTEFSVFRRKGEASDPEAWKETVVGHCKTPINIHPLDVDADGDLDMVTGSRGDKRLSFHENLGGGRSWKERVIHSGEPEATGFMMKFADLNQDGRIDIITQSRAGGVMWLEHPGDTTKPWPVHVIGSLAPDHATGLELADINDDGRLDLITGGYSDDPRLKEPKELSPTDICGRLAWFEQPPDPTKPWSRHDISRRRRGMFDMFAAVDVNKDGLVDFVATRGNSGEYDGVLWLEQVRTTRPAPSFKRAREKDSAEVPLPRE